MTRVAVGRRPLTLLAVVGVVLGVVAWVVLPARAESSAARTVAQRYVDLVATGDEDELEQLWAMAASESPGGLRSAGELLVGAEQRIEVISVGEPVESAPADLPYQVRLEGFVELEVRYRLGGEERSWPLVLGKLLGESGSDIGDWRVATPLTGSIDWAQPGFADVGTDVYVGGVRQVRRPALVGGPDEDVQPLYPAVYSTQVRLDPWYAADPTTVVVTPGEPTAPPDVDVEPTKATRDRIRLQVLARFASCGDPDDLLGLCPVLDIVDALGVEQWGERRWWRGLTDEPTVTFDGQRLLLSDGVFRIVGPRGVHQVGFAGSGTFLLDNQSWRPAVFDLDVREVS